MLDLQALQLRNMMPVRNVNLGIITQEFPTFGDALFLFQ